MAKKAIKVVKQKKYGLEIKAISRINLLHLTKHLKIKYGIRLPLFKRNV